MVAHYGRQAQPDGRISKQPIVYINHTNRACPQPFPTMPAPGSLGGPVMAGSGAAGCGGGRPPGNSATDAGDAPLP